MTYRFVSLGRLLDDALEAIEKDTPKLKNVLDKNYARLQVDAGKLGELIDLIATVLFHHEHETLQGQGHPRPCLRILPRRVRQR